MRNIKISVITDAKIEVKKINVNTVDVYFIKIYIDSDNCMAKYFEEENSEIKVNEYFDKLLLVMEKKVLTIKELEKRGFLKIC